MTTPTLNVKTAADMLQVHPNTIENQVAHQTADRMRGGQPQNAMGSAMGKRPQIRGRTALKAIHSTEFTTRN